jgi:CheY-like chemotaxis protein
VASDGNEGVRAALEARPDVTIIDLGLPGIDGLEVARQLRADPRGADLYLVALTGYGSADHRRRTEKAGFNLHLVKPVSPERLAQLLAIAPPERPDRDTAQLPVR